jgi:hypothetical protein
MFAIDDGPAVIAERVTERQPNRSILASTATSLGRRYR